MGRQSKRSLVFIPLCDAPCKCQPPPRMLPPWMRQGLRSDWLTFVSKHPVCLLSACQSKELILTRSEVHPSAQLQLPEFLSDGQPNFFHQTTIYSVNHAMLIPLIPHPTVGAAIIDTMLPSTPTKVTQKRLFRNECHAKLLRQHWQKWVQCTFLRHETRQGSMHCTCTFRYDVSRVRCILSKVIFQFLWCL